MTAADATTEWILGLDLGTTTAKALALDVEHGRVVASATVEHPTVVTSDDGHEQDPHGWWDAVCAATREVMAQLATPPRAVGLSGQMHSLLLLDGRLEPVRPAMTWADRRVGDARRRLAETGLFAARTGNDPVDAFTAPKLAWLAEEHPDDLARARHLLLAKDWIGYRLTGALVTDRTDALGTLLWDARTGRWDDDLFAACDASSSLGVPVLESTALRGAVTPAASASTGIPVGTPVIAGAGDVSAAALGGGAEAGAAMCMNVGTAAQVTGMTSEIGSGPGFLFGSPVDAGFVRMASVYAAGASIRRFEERELDGRAIGDAAAAVPAGADGQTYLPFLFGASVPRRNDLVRDSFHGGSADTALRSAAVLEGVAYACADAVDAVAEVAGQPARLVIVGGVTASSRFRDALAATVPQEVVRMPSAGSALGAAMLGALGVGAPGARDVIHRLPSEPIPVPDEAESYRAARRRFRRHVDDLV